MGGTPPLGYAPDGRSLAIVEEHAALVRDIFRALPGARQRAAAGGGARAASGIRVADRAPRSAASRSAAARSPAASSTPSSRTPIYAGEIGHKDKVYPGLHPAIIDAATWDRVQAMLADHLQGTARAPRAAERQPAGGQDRRWRRASRWSRPTPPRARCATATMSAAALQQATQRHGPADTGPRDRGARHRAGAAACPPAARTRDHGGARRAGSPGGGPARTL